MSTENKNCAPRLRFPGFTGEWKEKKLGEVTVWDKYFQGVPRELQPRVIKYPYVLANVFSEIERKNGDVLLLSTGNYVGWTTEELAGENLCEGEVVAIPWGGAANVKYARGKFVTADNRIATSVDTSVLDNKYLYYFMLERTDQINNFYRGASIKHPSMFDVLNMPICIPSLAEQKKIAECLSLQDELIVAQEQNVDALKEEKNGLMQQLFPQKGETIPRLRFPSYTGEWKEIVFGDVAGINRGGSPRPISNFLTTDPNGVNWIKIGDVEVDAKYISHAKERIIPEGVSHSREVHGGDFLLSNSMSFGRPYILKIDGCIHDGWLVIQDYQDTFDKEFLYYLLSSDSVLKQYQSFAAGSSVLNLNKDIVAKVRLSIPPSLAEQQKIAECLSTLDEEIAAESAKLDALKDHKKGLLQQLFPQPSK